MIKTISTGSRSWRRLTRACSRGTAESTLHRCRTSRFRNEVAHASAYSAGSRAGVSPGSGTKCRCCTLKRAPHWRINMTLLRLGVLIAAPLFAHDMWIEPTTFSPESGEIVGVKLRVGQDLLGDPLPRDSKLFNQFFVEDTEGR